MPKNTSTNRRKGLASYIDLEGTIIVKPYAICSKHRVIGLGIPLNLL
jgi:hypothetical protein